MQKEAGPWARKHLYDGRALVIVALRHGSDVTLSQEWPIQPRASEETKRRQGLAPHCSARVSSSGHLLNFERRIPHASRCGKMNRALQQCPRGLPWSVATFQGQESLGPHQAPVARGIWSCPCLPCLLRGG